MLSWRLFCENQSEQCNWHTDESQKRKQVFAGICLLPSLFQEMAKCLFDIFLYIGWVQLFRSKSCTSNAAHQDISSSPHKHIKKNTRNNSTIIYCLSWPTWFHQSKGLWIIQLKFGSPQNLFFTCYMMACKLWFKPTHPGVKKTMSMLQYSVMLLMQCGIWHPTSFTVESRHRRLQMLGSRATNSFCAAASEWVRQHLWREMGRWSPDEMSQNANCTFPSTEAEFPSALFSLLQVVLWSGGWTVTHPPIPETWLLQSQLLSCNTWITLEYVHTQRPHLLTHLENGTLMQHFLKQSSSADWPALHFLQIMMKICYCISKSKYLWVDGIFAVTGVWVCLLLLPMGSGNRVGEVLT